MGNDEVFRRRELDLRRHLARVAVVALFVSTIGPGCKNQAREPTPAPQPVGPVLLIGMDGLEWDILLPLLKADKLPNLAGLMDRGTYGLLQTFRPTASPVIWTSVATGKKPAKHGILRFAYYTDARQPKLYTSENRKTKAIWNILSDADKRVCSIGWWMTYPAEKVNGVMVAQTNTIQQLDIAGGKNIWKGGLLQGIPGQVHPPERQNEIMEFLADVERNLTKLTTDIFGAFRHPLSPLGRQLWNNCRWAFRADTTYLRIAEKLLSQAERFDLTLVYFGGPDVVGHRFFRYMAPEKYEHKPTAEQIENFGNVIADYYVFADRAVGRLLRAAPDDVTVMVASDHGMTPANLYAKFDPDDPPKNVNSGDHQHGPPGIFIAAGPTVGHPQAGLSIKSLQRSDLRMLGSVLDVTPTILALLGMPVGEDMDGHAMTHLFTGDFDVFALPDAVATYDDADFLARRHTPPSVRPDHAERLEQLRALGYIDEKKK